VERDGVAGVTGVEATKMGRLCIGIPFSHCIY